MKSFTLILGLAALTMTTSELGQAQAVQLQAMHQLRENKLDETTKASVKRAAAAALKVAVAAKKAEAAESIKSDMKEVHKAEKAETSDAITDSVDRYARDEERKAVERAVAHVERIRQKKLEVHKSALKEIETIKVEAQKKHDEINKATKDATDKAIAKASKAVIGLDVGPNK
jgi:hypothetical protein